MNAASSPANNNPLTPTGTWKLMTLGNSTSKSAPEKEAFPIISELKLTKAITTIPPINKYLGMNRIKFVKPLI